METSNALPLPPAPADADFDQFADAMRRRFPEADFSRMLALANLSTILACLRGTWVETFVKADMGLFKSMLQRLSDSPQSAPRPPAVVPPSPDSAVSRRMPWLRHVTGMRGTGVLRSVEYRRGPHRRDARQRAGNWRNLDIAPIFRASGGWEIH